MWISDDLMLYVFRVYSIMYLTGMGSYKSLRDGPKRMKQGNWKTTNHARDECSQRLYIAGFEWLYSISISCSLRTLIHVEQGGWVLKSRSSHIMLFRLLLPNSRFYWGRTVHARHGIPSELGYRYGNKEKPNLTTPRIYYLITVPKKRILNTCNILPFHILPTSIQMPPLIPLLIFSPAQKPVQSHESNKKATSHNGSDNTFKVPRSCVWFPELRRCDAANAVAYEVERVDDGALGVAFYVGGARLRRIAVTSDVQDAYVVNR